MALEGPRWFALWTNSHCEQLVYENLTARGFRAFLPLMRDWSRRAGVRRLIQRPMFPGYLFVRCDLAALGFSALAWLPYSRGPVCCDGQPSPVPAPLVEAIRRRLEQVNREGGESAEGLKPGDPLVVQGGPFAGCEAIFDAKASGAERVRVLLRLLGGTQVSAELPAAYVRRKTMEHGYRR